MITSFDVLMFLKESLFMKNIKEPLNVTNVNFLMFVIT